MYPRQCTQGNVPKTMERLDESEVNYRQATKIMPNYLTANSNLVNTL